MTGEGVVVGMGEGVVEMGENESEEVVRVVMEGMRRDVAGCG